VSLALKKFPQHVQKLITNDIDVAQLESRIHQHLQHLTNPSSPLGQYYYYAWVPVLAVMLLFSVGITVWKCRQIRSITSLPAKTTRVTSNDIELPELKLGPNASGKNSQKIFGE